MNFKIARAVKMLGTCAIIVLLSAMHSFAQNASLWLTNVERNKKLELQKPVLVFDTAKRNKNHIDVDASETFQSMDGFGYALTGGSASLIMKMSPKARTALLKEVFGLRGDGIGVSYLRLTIGASDLNDHVFSYDDLPDGQTDEHLDKFSLGPDLLDVVPVLKEILAVSKEVKIMASPWSAPVWMKTNHNVKGGSLLPEFYKAYAIYFVKYIQAMKAEGIDIDAITLQNEPLNDRNTPSLHMSALEEANFIKTAIGPAFAAAGIKTKVILFDHNCDTPEYPMSILADSVASKYTDGSGFHLYAGTIDAMTKVHNAFPTKNLYFTEQMVIERHGNTIDMPVERLIIGAPRNWSKNVILWNLAADPEFNPHTDDGGCPFCQGAVTIDRDLVSKNIAYYAVAHASKFVRPGSVRIASNAIDNLPNVAFKTPDGKTVLIVTNVSGRPQKFDIGFNGKYIAAELNSGSVGTFVW